MAMQSVANTPVSALAPTSFEQLEPELKAEVRRETEMLDHLCGIQALACLLQKAHENIDDSHTGIYGTAMIIEQKANRMLELIGQG